jgi:uncharacterized membrane protein YoaK (UPF0700 family)
MLTLLAAAAGCVDAASFLGLGQVMTAAMTGNTVLLGLALGRADLEGALRAIVALAGFVAGAVVGAAIVDRGPRGVIWTPPVTAALVLELVVLVGLALAWHHLEGGAGWSIDYRYPLIVAAGVAMGIQSAAAQRVGVPGVTTTYVTGTLTTIAARLVGWLRSSAAAQGDRAAAGGAPWLQASVWLAYGAGAVFAGVAHLWWPTLLPVLGGVAGEIRWPSAALLLPITIVAVVILIAVTVHRRRPAPA